MHTRKSTLCVGIIGPNTAIDILLLKLCAVNKRNEGTLSEVISMHEELSMNCCGSHKIKRQKNKIICVLEVRMD